MNGWRKKFDLHVRQGAYIGKFRIKWKHHNIRLFLNADRLDMLDRCKNDEARRLLLGIKRSEHAK